MEAARRRYELRVGTVVSRAALATFRVAVRTTAVPRSTVYRFRVPADRDLSEVLNRLTERHVQVLEIRQCPEPRRRERGTGQVRQEEPREEIEDDGAATDGVVVPFRTGPCPPRADRAPRVRSSREPAPSPRETAQPDAPIRRMRRKWPTTEPPSSTALNQVSQDMSTKTTPIGPYRSAFQMIARDR
jgi:hypothetical protein